MNSEKIRVTKGIKLEEELSLKDLATASSTTGIGIADLFGNIVYINEAAVKMWGADDASELIGKSALMIADSHEEANEVLSSVIEHGYWTGEVTGKRKDGTNITLHLSACLVYNETGEPICAVDSFVDITDRKRMEEELRIKDFAIASSINACGIGDLLGNITYVNDAAVKMMGANDASELIGKSALMLAENPEDAQKVMIAVIENGSWSGEISGKRKDGTPITVHLTASLVRNENGDPICTFDSCVDITERKKIEEELRIKDFAISSSINGIGISDLYGNVTYVNDAAVTMYGAKDASDLLNKSALMFAQSPIKAQEVMMAILKKGAWAGEMSGYRKDGSPIDVHLSASLVRNEKGEPICIMDSFIDITDRKRMEKELRIKEFAIASSINGLAIGDLDGRISYVNDAIMKMIGTDDPANLIGKNATSFAESEELAKTILVEILEKGSWIGEITARRLDDKIIDVQLSANVVTDDNGAPICLMCSFVDITQRKKTEQELDKAYEELEMRVAERTEELLKANQRLQKEIDERKQIEIALRQKEKELERKSESIEETNTALKVLLEKRGQDQNKLEEKVLSNVKTLILPYLESLEKSGLKEKQKQYVEILKKNIDDLVSPFLQKLSSHYLNFTPTEIQVADLVKAGRTTKDISEMLSISDRGVEFHRNNIRKKLGLKNKNVNLRTHLLRLASEDSD